MIPAVTEEFLPAAEGSIWHGPVPRLATADGFDSYAEMPTTADFGYAAVRLNAAAISAPNISVTVQLRAPLPIEYHLVYLESWAGSTRIETHAEPIDLTGAPADTWITHTFSLVGGVDYDQAAVESSIAAGTFCVLGFAGGSWGLPGTLYYSQILVEIGGTPIPTRVYPRADGLGMGAPRLMDGRSPYRSERVFGML